MNEAGYTLVEMLVALAVIGATAAGVAEGAFALRRVQGGAVSMIKSEQSLATLQQGFASFLADRGPFRAADKQGGLQGSEDEFGFPCGSSICTATLLQANAGMAVQLEQEDGSITTLAMPGVVDAAFSYNDGKMDRPTWPAADAGPWLKSVTVLAGLAPDQRPVAVAGLPIQEAPDCEFDPIIKDCRTGADEHR